jgi:hypothetical protein
MTVAIISTAPRETRFNITWQVELAFDKQFVSDEWRRSETVPLFVPGNDGRPRQLHLEIWLAQAVAPLITRLAFDTQAVYFFDAFQRANYVDLFPRIDVEVETHSFRLVPSANKAVDFAPPSRQLAANELTATMARATSNFEYYGVRAEGRWTAFDNQGAIIWMTTELEVAAYEFLGGRLGNANFEPKLYLGPGYANATGRPSFKDECAANASAHYARCHELWGTRHEIIHNGRQQVRLYDAGKDAADRNNPRPLGPNDVQAFRETVAQTIRWMRTA